VRAWLIVIVAGCSFNARNGIIVDTNSSDTSGGGGDGSGSGSGSGDAAWWDTSWQTRFPIAIANGSSDPLPAGFQVGLPFDVAAAACASATPLHDDIRVVFGGSADLPRVIDLVGPPAWTWFRLAAPIAGGATSTGDYFVYCNNPAAPAASADPATVFDFFDDFDGTTLGSAWTPTGTVLVGGGLITCGAFPQSGVASTTQYAAAGVAMDFVGAPAGANNFWWGGFQNTADSQPWLIWYGDQDTQFRFFPSVANGQISVGSAFSPGIVPHLYGVEDYGNSMMWRLDDTPYFAQTEAGLPTTQTLRLWNGQSNTNSTVAFDSVRVRQAIAPPPAATAGSAEAR
jgi:hypothetical protein